MTGSYTPRTNVVTGRAEAQGLMDGMLTSEQAPNAPTRFTQWIEEHRAEIGMTYASELGRHFRWRKAVKGFS